MRVHDRPCASEEDKDARCHGYLSCTTTLFPGYGIEGDLHMLARSWVFVADIVASSERVVDLQTFSRMVRSHVLLCGGW